MKNKRINKKILSINFIKKKLRKTKTILENNNNNNTIIIQNI